jgi:regulator of protease activity HflC (stomatin/prohibitin superfamily)
MAFIHRKRGGRFAVGGCLDRHGKMGNRETQASFRRKNREEEENMKKTAILFLVLSLIIGMTGCSKRIGPGYVGIKVNLSGDNRGVAEIPITTGRVYYNIFTQEVLVYPTFMQTAVWSDNPNEGKFEKEAITFTNCDQLQVAADISLAYQIEADKVPAFYVKFRSDDIDKFTHGFLRNMAREKFDNAAGKYKIEQIMGDNANFLKEARDSLQAAVKDVGVKITQFGFVGAPRPPQAVIDAINAKVKATQDAIQAGNKVAQSKAEAEQAIAKARGEAESNRILTASLSPMLLDWRRLQIQADAVAKWNGARPMVEGSGSGMLLQINPGK